MTSMAHPWSEEQPSNSDAINFSQPEGASPDLLKNTPSNIARLEDVIEQSKGRQKYLARTKSPSDGEDVRWYFCKVPLGVGELSASVPRTEIVGKSDYFRFSMRDSLALEASFLQREEELLAYWWKEYAECSEGPSGSQITNNLTSASQSDDLYAVEEERVGVPVKGGLYEVDLTRRHCFPVYWNGENRRVLRGQWFARKGGLDWIPLREDVAEQLELAYRCQVWHRRKFQPSGLFAARVDIQGSSPGLHALFTGEDDTWEAWLVFDKSGFKLGGGNTIKLRRGFSSSGSLKPTQDELRQQKEEEMDDYCSQVPVGHLVFMVHGIGQRLQKANLVDDVGDFRRVTASLAERHLSPYQRSTQRVLFIPCQWRKGLKLSGESAVEKITLDGVRGLRVTLSATVHDVLYYMSPIYCQHIIDSVSNQLNRLYLKFLKRNPGYNGKVSIYGHSLGSVLSYDILCHQESLSSPFPMESVRMESLVDQGSHIEGAQQSASSIGSVAFESNRPNINGGDSENIVQDHPSPSCKYFNERKQLSYTKNRDEEKSHDQSPLSIDESQHSVEGKVVQQCQAPFYEDKSSWADPIMHPEGGTVDREGVSNSGEAIDKDKLISLLEDEVRSLKARIAQLEQCHHLRTLSSANDRAGKDPHYSLQDDIRKGHTAYIKYTKLDFKVDTFFAVGSPLGVFLALRNIRIGIGKGQDYWQDEKVLEEMPSCRQMFNIFHPFDPVAYRIEPLVCKEYISKRPVIIPYHRGGKRLHIGFQEFTEEIATCSQAVVTHVNTLKVKAIRVLQSRSNDNTEESMAGAHDEERSYGSLMMKRLTGSEDGRIDHVLQEKTFQHPYISALGSHTNYWRDYDTALFIIKHLYRDIPEEPPTDEESDHCGSGTQRKPVKLFYVRDVMDEDIPLTFSDSLLVREFSRKAKKVMKAAK
ncbi:phospholipase SGR2 isoform X1 [Ananas comosus]|uniref:Phospholipase SGR2 isoform X1 n=1 Tax=Ananas comosus TaxID=4615 RepID=A0A6P5EXR1_ANACO|nr:phospholipase SGR2 isoform X1 [Ananas comosus]